MQPLRFCLVQFQRTRLINDAAIIDIAVWLKWFGKESRFRRNNNVVMRELPIAESKDGGHSIPGKMLQKQPDRFSSYFSHDSPFAKSCSAIFVSITSDVVLDVKSSARSYRIQLLEEKSPAANGSCRLALPGPKTTLAVSSHHPARLGKNTDVQQPDSTLIKTTPPPGSSGRSDVSRLRGYRDEHHSTRTSRVGMD